MNDFGNDYASILMHQARMREIVQKAENERKRRGLLERFEPRLRRAVRINNDPIR